MVRVRRLTLVLATLVTLGAAHGAAAQSASILASATVSPTTLNLVTLRQLDFGLVTPGVTATVNPRTSGNAGKVEIHGAQRAEFSLTIVLPAVLRFGVGPITMPIAFGAQGACHRDRDQQNACQFFNPAGGLTNRIRNQAAPDNTYFIWLGGAVAPTPSQQPGTYTGTVTASVAYTGN